MPATDQTPALGATQTGAAAESSTKAFTEALATAEKTLTEAAKRAEKALREGVEALRTQTKVYTENAGGQVDAAQRYVLERVKERPVAATLTGFGVGLVVGLLLSSRGR